MKPLELPNNAVGNFKMAQYFENQLSYSFKKEKKNNNPQKLNISLQPSQLTPRYKPMRNENLCLHRCLNVYSSFISNYLTLEKPTPQQVNG